MNVVTRGFRGRRRAAGAELPPGQYLTPDFPVLSAGPTPRVDTAMWEFTITTDSGKRHTWSWDELMDTPAEPITTDIHCVTKWSKLGTHWKGVSLDVLLDKVDSTSQFALAESYGGYTTNVPVADLTDGKAWIAYEYEGLPLASQHGGPARLLVPHLYFWKSAKWIRGIRLMPRDEPGFWENAGYHIYGDPWREQRYTGD